MGEVLLGLPGPWAKDNREEADHYTTKIGGLPDWPIPEVDIQAKLLECGSCGSCLCLVMQLYAPLSSETLTIEERTIYVLGCTTEKCGNNPLSWRVLRVQKSNCGEASSPKDEHSSMEPPSVPESSNKWLDDIWTDSPFGDDIDNEGVNLEELGRALSEAANLVSHSRKQTSHLQHEVKMVSPVKPIARLADTKRPVVPCFYTYCQKESSPGHVSTISSNNSFSIKDKECDLDNAREDETWEEEGYEYDQALFVDRTFMKFKKRLDAYPEQCFRYSYGGRPLLASKELKVPPKCELCGAFRQYEVQLMPPLLHFLREASSDSYTHSLHCWEWMTLIVYTCSKNCSHVVADGNSNSSWTVAEETVLVQSE